MKKIILWLIRIFKIDIPEIESITNIEYISTDGKHKIFPIKTEFYIPKNALVTLTPEFRKELIAIKLGTKVKEVILKNDLNISYKYSDINDIFAKIEIEAGLLFKKEQILRKNLFYFYYSSVLLSL